MTLSSDQSQQTYAGNDVATTFAIPYRVLDKAHLTITELDEDGGVTVLVETTDFTFSNLNAYLGWQVNLVSGGVARPLPSGHTLTIARTPPFTQLVSLRNQGSFQAATLEDKVDYLTMLIQRLRDMQGGAVFKCTGDVPGSVYTAPNRVIAVYAPQLLRPGIDYTAIDTVITLTYTTEDGDSIYALCQQN